MNDSTHTCTRKNTCCQDFSNFQQYKLKILLENLLRHVIGIKRRLDIHLHNSNLSLLTHPLF